QISHRSLHHYAVTAAELFQVVPEDRVLQFAPISFDTSIEEIFPCLITGAALVLRSDEMVDSVAGFLEKCWQWQLTVLDLPTTYWHEVTEELSTGAVTLPESLRLVIVGGDRMLPTSVKEWRRHAPSRVRLMNTYGPTEITVVATSCDLSLP